MNSWDCSLRTLDDAVRQDTIIGHQEQGHSHFDSSPKIKHKVYVFTKQVHNPVCESLRKFRPKAGMCR